MAERILIVAPSWVGDAILSESLVAVLRDEPLEDPLVDVLAPPWCAPVYARVRGIAEIIASPFRHGELGIGQRRALARTIRSRGYTCCFVLPNSFKSALIPWLAGIPRRIGYGGEARRPLLTEVRRREGKPLLRLVDRYVALAVPRGHLFPTPTAPVLVPNAANAAAAMRALTLSTHRPIAILCPGAEYGPAKRWPAEHFIALARRLLDTGYAVWLLGSPNDQAAAMPIAAALAGVRDLTGRTDLGTAIDLLSLASIVVSNDSGLMHAAAAVGRPLVALFGSSSPAYTPPLSPHAQIAKIDIDCSPCFQRECPLGHFKCMRELRVDTIYDLAHAASAQAPS
ncbi:MAG TPA: lipopolysaccharide heptosyltransferase II [Casimicrobiaceae bacterium]|jgi:heptosyltransferase-2|nr:lipopolysaccharide heptosyltransferase II [Casimicrobiaceae bacterium]